VKSNAATAAFLANIATLNRRGFHVLADQLVEAGDDQAYKLAAGAVKSSGTARSLTSDINTQVKHQNALTAAKANVESKATMSNYAVAAQTKVKATATFYANLRKLASRGFSVLASQLLDASDEEAETVAAQAVVASDAVVRGMTQTITTAKAQETAKADLVNLLSGATAATSVNDIYAQARYAAGYGIVGPRSSASGPTDTGSSKGDVNFYGNVGWDADEVARRIVVRQADAATMYNLAGV
jgi:major membrane immunogen (membrane-anchored lipoprotein)